MRTVVREDAKMVARFVKKYGVGSLSFIEGIIFHKAGKFTEEDFPWIIQMHGFDEKDFRLGWMLHKSDTELAAQTTTL